MFGLVVTTQTAISSPSSSVDRYKKMIIVGTSTSGVNNVITEIKDVSDFTTKFGNDSPSLPYIKFIFNNDSTGQNSYCFISGKDAANTPVANLLFGINQITKALALEPSVLICPEAFALSTQSDRTTIYNALNTIAASKANHKNFVNTGISTATKIAAITERALYQSSNGSSALYFEFYEDNAGSFIPVALHAAVIALVRSYSENPYEPPSGSKYPALGIKGIRNNNVIVDESDYNDYKNNGINVAVLEPVSGSYLVWGSRTLSTDKRWLSINTGIAASITEEKLKAALIPFLQTASDPRGSRALQAERAVYSVMEDQFASGALTADASGAKETSFKVVLSNTTISNKKISNIAVYARFVETVELIQVDIYSVDLIP